MKISNLAICLYGQYRSGDVCVPHLKSIIDNIEVDNIDVFCSVKTSLSFHASQRLLNMGVQLLKNDDIEHITKYLTEHLSPSKINFIHESEALIHKQNTDTEFNHHGVLSPAGVVDSLLLKQQHEAETGNFYDAVILLRYDVMYRPLDYIPKLITQIQLSDDLKIWPNDPDSLIAPGSNHAVMGNDPGRYTMFNNMINDLFMVFTGAGADRICYKLIEYLNELTSIYGNQTQPKYEAYYDYMNFHVIFGRLGSTISLHMIKTPGISERWHTSGIMDSIETRLINDPHGNELHMIVARPNDEIRGLNPNINEEFVKIGSFWNNA
jgi:hypothetical protein